MGTRSFSASDFKPCLPQDLEILGGKFRDLQLRICKLFRVILQPIPLTILAGRKPQYNLAFQRSHAEYFAKLQCDRAKFFES